MSAGIKGQQALWYIASSPVPVSVKQVRLAAKYKDIHQAHRVCKKLRDRGFVLRDSTTGLLTLRQP